MSLDLFSVGMKRAVELGFVEEQGPKVRLTPGRPRDLLEATGLDPRANPIRGALLIAVWLGKLAEAPAPAPPALPPIEPEPERKLPWWARPWV